jgi:hypothetical protein
VIFAISLTSKELNFDISFFLNCFLVRGAHFEIVLAKVQTIGTSFDLLSLSPFFSLAIGFDLVEFKIISLM